MLTKSTKILQILKKCQYSFSVHNYMKTIQPSQVTRYHGRFRVDQQRHFDLDPQTLKHFIRQQKILYKQQSAKWKTITDQYYQISSSRRDSRLTSVPERYDHYEYYTKTTWKDTRQYFTVYRRTPGQSQEQLVLDIMDYPYIRKHYQTAELLSTSFSPMHKLVAFAIDLKNNEKSVYFIARTEGSRELLKIGQSTRSTRLEDAHDLVFVSQSKVYFIRSQNHRPCRLCSLDIESGESEELFFEKNEEFYLGLRLSKDKRYLLLSGVSKIQSQTWILDLNGDRRLSKVWQGAGKTYINHIDGYFVVWSVRQTSQIKLIKDEQIKMILKGKGKVDFSRVSGRTIYTSTEEEAIEDIDLLQNVIVLYGYRVTKPFIKIIHHTDGSQKILDRTVKMPFQFGSIAPCTNEDYRAKEILFSVSTPFTYEQIYSYSITKDECKVIQSYEHTGPALHTSKYHVETIQVPATDMNTIPLTIIGPKKRRTQKLLLNFYGCYGLPQKIPYDNVAIAALENGWTICHAHIRGGNERGHKWHSQAQGDNRIRSWMDVEEVVGYLLREQYTHPSLLFLMSSSAGAINLWNVISRKPYLYKGAIFRAPFLDVLSSLMDPSQPLSNTDYQQFGNPILHPKSYQQIATISPYENIAAKEYPAIMISAGENDYRTPMTQVAKFVSRLRERKVEGGKVVGLGGKGVSVAISQKGSHLGQADVGDQNYKACEVYGYMDWVINNCSRDCKLSGK